MDTIDETIWGLDKGGRPPRPPKPPRPSGPPPRHPGGRTCGMFAIPVLALVAAGVTYFGWLAINAIAASF